MRVWGAPSDASPLNLPQRTRRQKVIGLLVPLAVGYVVVITAVALVLGWLGYL